MSIINLVITDEFGCQSKASVTLQVIYINDQPPVISINQTVIEFNVTSGESLVFPGVIISDGDEGPDAGYLYGVAVKMLHIGPNIELESISVSLPPHTNVSMSHVGKTLSVSGKATVRILMVLC